MAKVDEQRSNQLEDYVRSLYMKLSADVQQRNRHIAHNGIRGSENERALADLLKDFLPIRFGVEQNAIIIDRNGKESREADIVIYDNSQPKFFHKIIPVEHVYAVVEVKTTLTLQEASDALEKLGILNSLEFRPALTPYWESRTGEQKIPPQQPPSAYVFAFASKSASFETFADWFPWDFFNRHRLDPNFRLDDEPIRLLRACSLDQGTLSLESSNGYVSKHVAGAPNGVPPDYGYKTTTLKGTAITIDPAKSLFLFLSRLWFDLEHHQMHPGFDIRSYLSPSLGFIYDGN